jgi:MFS family permease
MVKKRFDYKYYLLGLLTVIAVFNYLDRFILPLAIEPLKREFDVSDSQLGLMSGFAFSLFYAVAGIPLARWADRGNRNHVVTLTTGLWSLMVAISAMVTSFWQLLAVRIGVAVGESGCVPTAQSLISDYFDRAERPHAMSIYWMSLPLATITGYLVGGWLIEQVGWRMTFMVIGIPGVLLAILARLTLRETRTFDRLERDISINAIPQVKQVPLQSVVKTLWRGRAFRQIVMAFCISLFCYGIGVWIPAFFIRSYGMDTGEVGLWLGLVWGVGGLGFTFLGGFLATRYAPNREGLQMKAVAVATVLCCVFHVLCFLSSERVMSFVFMTMVFGVLMPLVQAPVYSAIQSLVEERMRAVAIAFIFMLSNLTGFGFGPIVAGMLSDLLEPGLGQESLRYALLFLAPAYLWCAYHCWKTATTIEDDIRSVEETSALPPMPENASAANTPCQQTKAVQVFAD